MNSRHYLLIVFVLLCLVAQFMKPEGDVARMANTDRAGQAVATLANRSETPQGATQSSPAGQASGAPEMTAAQLWAADVDAEVAQNDVNAPVAGEEEDEIEIEIADFRPELIGTQRTEVQRTKPKPSAKRDTGRMLSDPRSPEEMDSSMPFDRVVG